MNAHPTAPADQSAAPHLKWWSLELLAILCWGCYGLTLSKSAAGLGGSRAAALIFVCLAYTICFLPSSLLAVNEAQKQPIDTKAGRIWGTYAGLSGFLGALCLVLCLSSGRGVFMLAMPLVFGAAPLTNAVFSIVMKYRTEGRLMGPNFWFGVGVGLVAFAAYWVVKYRPVPPNFVSDVKGNAWFMLALGTALFWGTYGPLNLRSMQKFGGSPARTLQCVCLVYAVGGLITALAMAGPAFTKSLTYVGVGLGLLAGLQGFGGAIGVSYGNRVGMRFAKKRGPILNMPLIFGGASVTSVIAAVIELKPQSMDFLPSFLFAVAMLICGMVLVIKNNPAH